MRESWVRRHHVYTTFIRQELGSLSRVLSPAACAAAQQPQAGCAYQAAGQEVPAARGVAFDRTRFRLCRSLTVGHVQDASSAWSMFSSFVN